MAEAPEECNLEELLDSALKQMKLSEARSSPSSPPHNPKDEAAAQLQEMIAEFTQSCTSSRDADCDELPAKIDSTLNRLLNLADDEAILGSTQEAELASIDVLVEQLMAELTSKELLHEPFAEMAQQYPIWLEKNSQGLDAERLADYRKQCSLVQEISAKLSDPSFDQNKESNQLSIFHLMQQMQEIGSPPEDLLRELGMNNNETLSRPTVPECVQM